MRTVLLLACCAVSLQAAPIKAGVAKVEITPKTPVWMSGYAARTHASEGTLVPLWAKALAIETSPRQRVVIVTIDAVGIPKEVSDKVAERVGKLYKLERSQFILNCSHTHSGPMIWPNLRNLAAFPSEEEARMLGYRETFQDALVNVIGAALKDMAPATLSYGEGTAGFSMNRRSPSPTGVKNAPYAAGPVDHRVPVVKVMDRAGKVRAILFGYACHNTTLGADIYRFNWDYAVYAQAALEKEHPGATALFMTLCAGDQNPYPRGLVAQAQQHGEELAQAVEKVLGGALTPVTGPIATTYSQTPLQLAPKTRADFEKELKDPVPGNVRRAAMMLKKLDANETIDKLAYPIAAVRFGHSLTLLALGGEVTVDYALRMQREYQGVPFFVAGFSYEVMSYIPSARVLKEGGYEAVDSMAYYGQAGPYTADVEDRIFSAIHATLTKLRR
jgi:hypothetical protein